MNTARGSETLDEPSARAVWALRSVERDGAGLWSEDDAEQATREALSALPAEASDAQFLASRAERALQRLQPRLPGLGEWLAAPGWFGLGALALLLGAFVLGAAIDHVGGGQRINLLAPPVWAVVLWNLAVYLALLAWPWRAPGDERGALGTMARWLAARFTPPAPASPAAAALLARVVADGSTLTAPLTRARLARLMHLAAALLALGLVAGMYLRGLVLDYRAGWQSTFLDAAQVQALLDSALAPAAALSGIEVPRIEALRSTPELAPSGPAAPWLHLYAATLLIFVVLPRGLLAAAAAWRAARLARHLLRPAHDPALAALAATARARPLRLGLWHADGQGERLMALLKSPAEPGIVWVMLGDEQLAAAGPAAPPTALQRLQAAWTRWRDPAQQQRDDAALALWRELDAVIVPGPAEPPAALTALTDALQRPLLALPEAAIVAAEACWVHEAALWQALVQAVPAPRSAVIERLASAAAREHAERLRQAVALIAEHHASVAALQLDVPPEADAGERLREATEPLLQRLAGELQRLHGQAEVLPAVPLLPLADSRGVQLRKHVPEGKAAVLGGALTGALTGLKADLASGGLTMGGGLLAGGLLGALGAAGVARGANRLRGTQRDQARWDADALRPLLQLALMQYLRVAHPGQSGPAPAAWPTVLDAALAADELPWRLLWTAAQAGDPPAAASLHEPIDQLLRRSLQQLHPGAEVALRELSA